MIPSLIVILLQNSCPPTIFRRVWTIIIDTIDRVTLGAISHISNKAFERLTPAVANGNTTTTIPAVRRIFLVIAPFDHKQIRIPKRMFAKSVGCLLGDSGLFGQTSATSGKASLETASIYLAIIPAITKAIPDSRMFSPTSIGNNQQATKSLPRNVFNVRMGFGGIMKEHRNLLGCGDMGRDVRASPAYLFVCIFIIPQKHIFPLRWYL